MRSHIKAVVFDIGGVVVRSPVIAIHEYEKSLGLPHDYLNVQITSRGSQGALQRFERGETANILDFYADFGRELSDTAFGIPAYEAHMKKTGPVTKEVVMPKNIRVDGRELFGRMMRESQKFDGIIVHAIKKIRESGQFLVMSITNNFTEPHQNLVRTPSSSTLSVDEELAFLGWSKADVMPSGLREMFDIFVESSQVGMRKPEKRMYELGLRIGSDKLQADGKPGLDGKDVVMLDDLRINLKAARELGMKTIHVPIGGSQQAIRELELILGIPLLAPHTGSASAKL